tara:strand:- start:3979 stop:4869 length:891 start_codon:yes stop_codon:yes gene_type:complete
MDPEEEVQKPTVGQEQVHDLLFSREIGWQEIIYDLINTDQLDPWNIDITTLTERYLEKIQELEQTDFFISSKVLLAASLLVRIKSEILLNKYIKSIDEILFGKKEEKKYSLERIELEEEIPDLTLRSPLPRFRKVTLKELIDSLSKAINTENRRIKKEIVNKNALRETSISLPKKKFSIKDKIRGIYDQLTNHFGEDEKRIKISYTDLIGKEKEERILSFYPLLQLENQSKVWLHQDGHFEEIYVWLKETYLKHNPDPFEEIRKELEADLQEMNEKERKRAEKIDKDFENPLGEEI